MQKKGIVVIGSILILGLAVSLVWGCYERKAKQEMTNQCMSHYQRAFHELSSHLDRLEDELGKSMVVNSEYQRSSSFMNIYKLSYAAQSNLEQISLEHSGFSDVQQFLRHVNGFVYAISKKKYLLNKEEYIELKELYNQSRQAQENIFSIQRQVLEKKIQFNDQKGLKSASKKSYEEWGYSVVKGKDFGMSFARSSAKSKTERLTQLKGEKISPLQAKKKVATFLGLANENQMHVIRNEEGLTYSVEYKDKEHRIFDTEVTVVGGHVIWMDSNREVNKKQINIESADSRARAFLKGISPKKMIPFSRFEGENIAVIMYVPKEKNIVVYPEMVAVKVALDTGEILGFDGDEFLLNNITIPQKKPQLTLLEAKKHVSAHFTVEKTQLALIYNDIGKLAYCYEIIGSSEEGNKYRIFVNVDSGREEHIEKLLN